MKKRSESSLVTALGNYLQVLENSGKILFWSRAQAGTLPFQRSNGKWQSIRLGRDGISDLWCIPCSREIDGCILRPMIWIEAKLDDGTQSEVQKNFEKIVKSAGYEYWIIHDCDELESKFKHFGVLP